MKSFLHLNVLAARSLILSSHFIFINDNSKALQFSSCYQLYWEICTSTFIITYQQDSFDRHVFVEPQRKAPNEISRFKNVWCAKEALKLVCKRSSTLVKKKGKSENFKWMKKSLTRCPFSSGWVTKVKKAYDKKLKNQTWNKSRQCLK